MKINKTICIENDINDMLSKEDNSSQLINHLLREHYKDFNKTDEEIIDEVKDKIKDKAEKQADYDKYNTPEHKAKVKERMRKAHDKKYGIQ